MIPRLDPSRLDEVERSGGPSLRRELVDCFLQNVDAWLQEMRDALASGDKERLGRTAHSLKSSARWVGALRLADLAWQLEQTAVTVQPRTPDEWLTDLTRELDQSGRELRLQEGILRTTTPRVASCWSRTQQKTSWSSAIFLLPAVSCRRN